MGSSCRNSSRKRRRRAARRGKDSPVEGRKRDEARRRQNTECGPAGRHLVVNRVKRGGCRPCGGAFRVWARDGEAEPVLGRTQTSAIANRSALLVSGFSAQEQSVVCWLSCGCQLCWKRRRCFAILCQQLPHAIGQMEIARGPPSWNRNTSIYLRYQLLFLSYSEVLCSSKRIQCLYLLMSKHKSHQTTMYQYHNVVGISIRFCVRFVSKKKLAYKARKDIIARPATHK